MLALPEGVRITPQSGKRLTERRWLRNSPHTAFAVANGVLPPGGVRTCRPDERTCASAWWRLLEVLCSILGARLCWAIDNKLTRKVALNEATWVAAVKGSVAGPVRGYFPPLSLVWCGLVDGSVILYGLVIFAGLWKNHAHRDRSGERYDY
jgi:hypothetical protein